MLIIRLTRTGKAKMPNYRLIVSEKTKDPWGAYLENVGSYNPRTKEAVLNAERIKYWISKGAQPTATVNNLLVNKNVIVAEKQNAVKISKKRKEKLAAKKKAEKPE